MSDGLRGRLSRAQVCYSTVRTGCRPMTTWRARHTHRSSSTDLRFLSEPQFVFGAVSSRLLQHAPPRASRAKATQCPLADGEAAARVAGRPSRLRAARRLPPASQRSLPPASQRRRREQPHQRRSECGACGFWRAPRAGGREIARKCYSLCFVVSSPGHCRRYSYIAIESAVATFRLWYTPGSGM